KEERVTEVSQRPRGEGSASISRRDFVNGVLVGASGLAVGHSVPLLASAEGLEKIGVAACGDTVGADPRFSRGGNSPATFNVAHWLRDRRLKFESGIVTLAPGCDGLDGRFPIADDDQEYDVIIAGAGIAGLSTAFYLLRRRPGLRILMLEANEFA